MTYHDGLEAADEETEAPSLLDEGVPHCPLLRLLQCQVLAIDVLHRVVQARLQVRARFTYDKEKSLFAHGRPVHAI